jgi:hypothetical protein
MAEAPTQVRLCCDHVANAVFPHHNDKARRDQLALALDGLAKAAIVDLERRRGPREDARGREGRRQRDDGRGVLEAKSSHAWQNRTGTLEGGIGVVDYAREDGAGVVGVWGVFDVVYALIHELGGTIVPRSPRR